MTLKQKTIGYVFVTYPVLGLMLFGPARTLAWAWGWSYFGVFVVACLAVTRWLYVHSPGLLEERMRIGGNQKGWDKVFVPVIGLAFLAWWMSMPYDVAHGSTMPVWLHVAGIAITLASFRLFFAVLRINPYASGVVRVQADRAQTVIDTGPYAVVRHPMYAAALVLAAGVPLWLGSWWGLVVGAAFSLVLAVRCVLEERVLAHELQGYAAYMKRVRKRLIPLVW